MKNRGAAGARRERDVRQYFRQRGFEAFKTSDSAVCDVVAMKRVFYSLGTDSDREHCLVYMCEVKGNKAGGPFSNFRRPERQALIEAAERAGAVPLLAYWPPGGELRLIGADEWPEAREAA